MINDLKDFQKLLKLCRAQGVSSVNLNGLEVKFGDLPISSSHSGVVDEEIILNPYDGFPQNILSPEQLSHYARGGTVDDDPFLKKESSWR